MFSQNNQLILNYLAWLGFAHQLLKIGNNGEICFIFLKAKNLQNEGRGDDCHQKYMANVGLKMHINSIHDGKKPCVL